MTIYNVHIYREMRLVFGGIEAESHETAASIARDKLTEDADDIADCDGETHAALVDVQGDDEYEQSRIIDFEPEWQRKAASEMLAALTLAQLALNTATRFRVGDTDSYKIAAAVDRAIAKAKSATIPPAPADPDIHALLAERRQIADIWGVEDVLSFRPDLTREQAWQVLLAAERRFDATVGINWDVLACHAETLFGDAPEADEAEEA